MAKTQKKLSWNVKDHRKVAITKPSSPTPAAPGKKAPK